jgi:DNA polymerase I
VKRDTERVMLLAQYHNCLVLRLMHVFSDYTEMNYYRVCYTNVSRWYANKYNKMIKSQDITTDYTPDYKLEKQKISRGHHTIPKKGFSSIQKHLS